MIVTENVSKNDSDQRWTPWKPSCDADAVELEPSQPCSGKAMCIHFGVVVQNVQTRVKMQDESVARVEETNFKCGECGFSCHVSFFLTSFSKWQKRIQHQELTKWFAFASVHEQFAEKKKSQRTFSSSLGFFWPQ